MDHITAPALLAYRNSDVFATIVDVLRNIPKGRSCSADSLEDLLKMYVPVLSQFPFCHEPPTDPGLGTVYSELTKSSKLMYFPYSVLAQHQASRSHTSSDILALPSFFLPFLLTCLLPRNFLDAGLGSTYLASSEQRRWVSTGVAFHRWRGQGGPGPAWGSAVLCAYSFLDSCSFVNLLCKLPRPDLIVSFTTFLPLYLCFLFLPVHYSLVWFHRVHRADLLVRFFMSCFLVVKYRYPIPFDRLLLPVV